MPGRLAVIEFAAWVLIAPPRSILSGDFRSPRPGQPERRILGEPIEIRAADGARLAGRWLAAPGPLNTGRTAILLHGFAEASSALEARRAAALNRHGWNVAVLDSRGYGKSDGPFSTFGGREAGDIHAWLRFLSERTAGIDPERAFAARALGPFDGSGHRHANGRRGTSPSRHWCWNRPWSTSTCPWRLSSSGGGSLSEAHGPAGHPPGRQAGGRANS